MKEAPSEDILDFMLNLRALMVRGLKILDTYLEKHSKDKDDADPIQYINWDNEVIEVLKEMKHDLTRKEFVDKLAGKFSDFNLDRRKINNEVMSALKYNPGIHKKKNNGRYYYELTNKEQTKP